MRHRHPAELAPPFSPLRAAVAVLVMLLAAALAGRR
jgi:hypothetical protein